jgi:DUF438 domain-containing protein
MTTEELKILDEIMDFIDKENVYLYLTVRDYALENKPEWVEFLQKRKTIKFLILYTNSKRRKDKVKKNCFYEYLDSKYQNLES